MKKKWIMIALVACAIALAGCKVVSEPEPIAVQSVTLNTKTLTLAPGVTRKLKATVKPDNADDKSVKWSSSDEAVAMVGSDGTVGTIKAGTAIITAQAGDKSATCHVTVKSETNTVANGVVDGITLDMDTLTLEVGKTGKLTAIVTPDNADDKTVKWSSSDTSVATVDNGGTVVAIKTGRTIITAQAGEKTAICVITVNDAAATNPDSPVVSPDSPVAVDGVTLSTITLMIEPGKTRTLTATVTPNNADDKVVTWSSSDTLIATVDNDGTITAHAEGVATITAKAGGKEAACTVTVKQILIAVENVELNTTTLTLMRNETGKLTATVTPSNADDKSVAWSSSDTSVATVGTDGVVTAVKAGTATITAQAGYMTAECTVTVNPILVENIVLDRTTLTLTRGDTGKLIATVTPSNADDKSVAWSSSDTAVVKVGDDGTVTALSKGAATITATTREGGKAATCAVTVNPILVNNVILNKNTLTLESNMTGKLTATVTPSNADDKSVAWSSSDTSVATVDADGTVTAVKAGTVTITVKAGGKTAECTLTVRTDHSYSGGKCTLCGAKPYMENGEIDENGVLTKYTGSATTVIIPDGVTGIGSGVFDGRTNLKSVTIPDSVTSIEDKAFYGCTGLTSVTIPGSVMSIGYYAFYGCAGLTSMSIPRSVTSIGEGAFCSCTGLKSVSIPESVTSIGGYAFTQCESLTRVWIPCSVTSIGRNAFSWCTGLTWVVIDNGVTSIEEFAFYNCKELETVQIPISVTSIGYYAFMYCLRLETVTYNGTEKEWEDINIDDKSGLSSKKIKFLNQSITSQ